MSYFIQRREAALLEEGYPGGRCFISEAFERRGIPKGSLQITLSSLTNSSLKQYETCLKKWWSFCKERKISPFDNSVENVLTFLTLIHDQGAAYSSINCYRSAIALIIGPEIGQDNRVKRFFQGLSKLRPPKPKYDSTWDPKIVLEHFSSEDENDKLSLKDLSIKLITLLALITAHRMQTFSLINIDNIENKNSGIEIKIPDRIKTSGINRKQPVLILPTYNNNKKICVASALNCYLNKTEKIRENKKSLFISLKAPFKAVTAQTLSRWVKLGLKKCDIDTNIFTAHSTRHVSTSAAKRNGIDIDTLRKTAGWTENSNTFIKFYNLRLSSDQAAFAKAIYNI